MSRVSTSMCLRAHTCLALVITLILSACASRDFVETPTTSWRASTVAGLLEKGAYGEARDVALRRLEQAEAMGDQEALFEAELLLAEALVGLEEYDRACGYLASVKRQGPSRLQEDARVLLALSHDRLGHEGLARSYYEEIQRNQVSPDLWKRVKRRFSRYLTAARKPRTGSSSSSPFASFDLPIRPRSSWTNEPLRVSDAVRMEPIRKITVHHTALITQRMSEAAVADHLRTIQHQHFTRGWADIGYHYIIDMDGRVWEGRPITYQGAHAGNHELNRANVGVALLGNFNVQALPGAQETALRQLLASLVARYHVPLSAIKGHCHMRATDCPGWAVKAVLPGIVTSLAHVGAASRVHCVARGETLSRIARRYGVSLRSLRTLNPHAGDDLRPGDRIAIP